jgi:PHP family Zn ribbon phosphoesterase
MGSRDWLEKIATRAEPAMPADAPPFRMLLPLKYVIGELCGLGRETKAVAKIADQLLASVGPERFILAEADFDTLSRAATPQLARAIVAQREVAAGALVKNPAPSTTSDSQLSLL